MNQRSSHFVLGNSGAGYSSVYAKDYVPKQASKQEKVGQNPFRGSSLQHQGQSCFQTTNKQLMQNWGQVESSKLDNKILSNLRSHHFTLGNYNPQSVSTSHKLFYDRKPLTQQASSKQQESKIKMRMHNHDFKQQQWTNFQTSYKKDYHDPQGAVNISQQNQAARNNKHQGTNAIVFGNDTSIQMISTNSRQFTQKKINSTNSNLIKPSFQQTSALLLTGDRVNEPMQTINQMYYTVKTMEKNQLPEKTMNQLRATHFNLGAMKNNYQTQTNLYASYNQADLAHKAQIPIYECGTWVDKNAKFDAQSTNQREFNAKPVEPFKKHQANRRGGFELGGFQTKYETEFSKNFSEKEGQRGQNAKKPDNIMIGLDKGSYLTQQKSNYLERDLKVAHSDSRPIKQKNTEDHFKIGGTSNQAQLSTYQDEYRNDIENRNRMFHHTKV